MQPLDYPGPVIDAPGVLEADGAWTELGAGRPLPELLTAGRACVVAVGSNGSPPRLHAKLAAAGAADRVAMVPYEVSGIGIAHSAHVSIAGYVATTPYGLTDGRVRVVASWFTVDQLAAVDATERNYDRLPLPDSVRGVPDGAQAFASRWGVLAPGGAVLAATTQARVHEALARDPVLAELLPLGDPAATVAALRERVTATAVRERLREVGWVLPTGL